MLKGLITMVSAAALVVTAACSENTTKTEEKEEATSTKSETIVTDNIFLADWTGPYNGTPAFDKMKLADVIPALKAGIEENLAELDFITKNAEPATFENTIVAMERAGSTLNQVYPYFGVLSSNLSSDDVRKIQRDAAPLFSDFQAKVMQNTILFARIKAVYEGEEYKTLRADQQRVVYLTYDSFEKNGATLTGEAKERYAAINKELSPLHIAFSNNVLADEEGYVTYLTKDQLGGLPQSYIDAAASAATSREHAGEYAVTNTRSSMDPFLRYSSERALREVVWNNYYSRGDNGGEYDNNENIQKILKLRHERVQLLGYDNYASWRLSNRMAKTPENAFKLMETVWEASTARVAEEVSDMQAIANADNAGLTIEPWDYRYYAEKVRKDKYALDSNEVKQYLQLDNLREGMFMVAGELFNFNFAPVPEGSVPVFHEDVKVWEVTDKTTGKHIGLWYLDPFARKGKRSGAWATTYRSYENFNGEKTVLASNNSNFVKGVAGAPVLVSLDDASTFFHEFGHALHFFAANVSYPTLQGGVRDYTEFQSQLLERWLLSDKVINTYLVHVDTGEPMPAELIAKIKASSTFNQGFSTTEYLASAMMDMIYHTTDPTNIDPNSFEKETLARLKMPKEIVMRHRSPQFGHVFSGEGYSAGYYGYMWADVLTSDAAEAFRESPGGLYDKDVAKRLVDHLFAVRNAVDPAVAYRAFRGRDPQMEALMRDRGFPVPEK